jgi:hypothetical protein
VVEKVHEDKIEKTNDEPDKSDRGSFGGGFGFEQHCVLGRFAPGL